MATAIGFATQFYTLWDIQKEELFSTTITPRGEVHSPAGFRYICTYIKNISTDIDKVKKIYPDLDINEDLRGMSRSFDYIKGDGPKVTYAPELFSRGYSKGQVISECEDLKVLKWGFENEGDAQRIAIIEKTILDKFSLIHYRGSWMPKEQVDILEDRIQKAKKFSEDAEFSAQTFTFTALKNLDAHGSIFVELPDLRITIYFPEYKVLEYAGFEYGLPTIKGVGKKIKGKDLEVTVRAIENTITDEHYGETTTSIRLEVQSFKILK